MANTLAYYITKSTTTVESFIIPKAIYNLFPACTQLLMIFLEEFLVGQELKFLSRKVYAPLVPNLCLAHS